MQPEFKGRQKASWNRSSNKCKTKGLSADSLSLFLGKLWPLGLSKFRIWESNKILFFFLMCVCISWFLSLVEQLASSEPWYSFPWQISTAISAVGQSSAEVVCLWFSFQPFLCYIRQSYSRAPRGIGSMGDNSTHHSSLQSLRCDVLILWASFTGYAMWQFMFSVWR